MDQEADIEEGQSEAYYADDTEPVEEEIEENFYDREEEGEEGEEEEAPEEEEGRNRRRKHRGEGGDRRESRKRRSRDENEDRHKSRRRSGEDGYDGKEKRRSGGEYSDYESEGRSHRKHRSEEREGKSRRKHHKHRKDKSRKSKSRMDNSRGSHEMEPEEGELEDGEIDEEEDLEEHHDTEYPHDDIRNDRKKYDRENSDRSEGSYKHDVSFGEGEEEEGESGDDNQRRNDSWKGRNNDRPRENWRNQRGRGRRDDRRGGKMNRGGRKGPGPGPGRYHDYDNMDEESQGWMLSKNKRSPGGHRNQGGNHRHRDKYDRGGDRYEDGDSPPGPYDSPSDEDSVDEYGERRGKSKKSQSMLSMLGDDMLDPNIAVEEGQDLYKKKTKSKKRGGDQGERRGDRNRDRGDRGFKRKQNKDYDEEYSDQPKKKPLLQTPMEERPICRFFKEGKCQKGYDCPFNHDTVLAKKPELCKYYLNSDCSKGDNCIFMHSEYPCKFYHTGRECFGGDECKFSHDPLTDETRHLIDKKMEDDERHQGKRPSLLGSPPRHLKMDPEMHERIKKIPSIFDIEVFPPGQSPKKPPNQQGGQGPGPGPGPGPGGQPNRMQGPPQNMMGPPQRPSGFYSEINQGRMPGPGMMGPPPVSGAGPGMMGPPPVSGAGPMGPPPPGQMGPPPMHMGPPHGPPMGPPGPMNHGPMGPPGPRGPMGPPPGPGPMNQLNPALNPAVALVGALLQHATGVRPPLGGPGPNPGMMVPPGPQGPMMMPRPQGPQEGYGPNMYPENERQEGFNHEHSQGQNEMEQNTQSIGDVIQESTQDAPKVNDDPNKEKLAMMGLDPDTLNSLPAKQKELFLRLQGNKSAGEESPKHDTKDEVEQIKREINEHPKHEKEDVDDDWYSSDEEEGKGKKPKLTDILKNLNKQVSTPESPQSATPTSSSSALSVMQMINAIKTNAGSGSSATSPIGSPTHLPRDPRQRLDPRTGKPGGPAIIPIDGPEVKVEPPTYINSYEGDIAVYRLVPMSKDSSAKVPPPGLNLNDPQFKNDPRIQRMLKRMEATRGQTLDSGSIDVKSSSKENKPVDPRTGIGSGTTDRLNDPRVKGSSDPRIQRTISDTGGPKPQDPRLLRVQSTPVGQGAPAVDPRLGRQALSSGPPDPRLLGRQISREGHHDPRLGRQLSNQPTSSFDGSNINRPSDSKQIDPRMSSQVSASSDPRKLNRPNASHDPRNISRQNSLNDPRARVQIDQKLDLLTDPRMKPELHVDISNLKPLDPKIIQSSLEEGSDAIASQLEVLPETVENNNDQSSISDQTEKPKLDYRNDPRFKRKPAGKRKSSMDYASPLGEEGGSDSSTSYSAYIRPQTSNQRQIKTEQRVKSDPRLSSVVSESKTMTSPSQEQSSPTSSEQSGLLNLPLPELPPFIPPPEPEINTKDFFKTMDPTASPFC